jgi:hypothetical protein
MEIALATLFACVCVYLLFFCGHYDGNSRL